MITLIVLLFLFLLGFIIWAVWDIKTGKRRMTCESWARLRDQALDAGDYQKAKELNNLIKQDCEKWYLPYVDKLYNDSLKKKKVVPILTKPLLT